MLGSVDTRIPADVEEQVRSIHQALYPGADSRFVAQAFAWAAECFGGRYGEYQAIDARYHDFEHTLQGTLCLARLLHGWHLAEAAGRAQGCPPVGSRRFELALLAILFHDSGYLKKRSDAEGTGAKYTFVHVARSADFAREFLEGKAYPADEINAVRHMISCTGVNADLSAIPFRDETDRKLGCALATADLLGQMAAPDYVDKLPILFQEFSEAASHIPAGGPPVRTYASVDELRGNTRFFWSNYVRPKIDGDFGAIYRYLNSPYPDGPNPYLERIERNLRRLDETIRRP